MSIEFHCSQCSRLLRTADDAVGRMAQCPECGAQTRVPAPEASNLPPSAIPSGGGDISESLSPQPAESVVYPAAYQAGLGGGPRAGYPVDYANALNRVSTPAVCLIVTAVLGLIAQTMGLIANVVQIGAGAHFGPRQELPIQVMGPIAIGSGVIGIVIGVLILVGAMKMKSLENYTLAMTGAILAMIPCISPCCLLGLPFGIWAIVVLSDPAVKSAFKG
jgi:hypothetical protein